MARVRLNLNELFETQKKFNGEGSTVCENKCSIVLSFFSVEMSSHLPCSRYTTELLIISLMGLMQTLLVYTEVLPLSVYSFRLYTSEVLIKIIEGLLLL